MELASDLRARVPSPRVTNFESGTQAAEEWARIEGSLDRSWCDHDDVRMRYEAFCALPEEAIAAWLGWAVARTIDAVPAGATGSAFIDHLGAKLAIDVAAWWRPTARNYFDRITKPAILDLFDEVGGVDLRQRYGASKKHDLAASAEKLFAGDILVESDIKERALAWLPDALRFAPLDAAEDNDTDAASCEPELDTGPGMETEPDPADEDDSDPIAAAA